MKAQPGKESKRSLKTEIQVLREKGKAYREIARILGCSRGTVSKHCSMMVGHRERVSQNLSEHLARVAAASTAVIPRIEIQPTEYQQKWIIRLSEMGIARKEIASALKLPFDGVHTWCEDRGMERVRTSGLTNGESVMRRHWRLKALAVAYKGGCCGRCGFDTLGALTFHHRDPSEKEFAIGGQTRSWKRVRVEVDKCDLLCLNCHREVHEEIDQTRRDRLMEVRRQALKGLPSSLVLCESETCSTTFLRPVGQGNHKRFCSSSCRVASRSRSRREAMRERVYEYKGKSCTQCGYDRCKQALDFHHLDPEGKDFRIADGYGRAWKSLVPELDKCVILCANCHRLEHGGFWC